MLLQVQLVASKLIAVGHCAMVTNPVPVLYIPHLEYPTTVLPFIISKWIGCNPKALVSDDGFPVCII
jgi:hypothetical protein